MDLNKIISIFVLSGMLGGLAASSAATSQSSTVISPGTYSAITTPGAANTNPGYGVATDANGAVFLDYVDNNDVITWLNATISAPTQAEHLVIRSRDGNATPRTPQGYEVSFFEAGSGLTQPVGTFLSERYRLTGYQQGAGSISNFTNNPIQGFNLAPGTYDIQVRNLQGGKYPGYTGSHVEGIGWYQPKAVLNGTIGSAPTIMQVEDATWRDSDTGFTLVAQDGNSIGSWIDGQINGTGQQWVDFEVSNPDANAVYQLSARYRHNHTAPVQLSLFGVDEDGDLSAPLVKMMLDSTGGWQGTNFIDSAWEGFFTLPEGLSSIRLNTLSLTGGNGIVHLDSISLMVVPEPNKILLGAFFGLSMLLRRSRR